MAIIEDMVCKYLAILSNRSKGGDKEARSALERLRVRGGIKR